MLDLNSYHYGHGSFHQKLYTWYLGLVLYNITMKKMRPTDAESGEKNFGS